MSNELQLQTKIPALSAGKFIVTRIGLVLEGEPEWEEWQAFFDGMQRLGDFRQWNIGDALSKVDVQYGEAAAQLTANYPDSEYGTLRNWRGVAESIEFARRRANLSFSHHQEVAPLEPDIQDEWLDWAWNNGDIIPKNDLRVAIRRKRLENATKIEGEFKGVELYHGDMEEIVPALGQFDLIVTDPPYGVVPKYDSVDALEWDEFKDFLVDCRRWLEVCRDALKDSYNFFWFCSPRYAADIEVMFKELDLPIQSRIIWHRRSIPKGRASELRFINTWEMILHSGNRPLNFPQKWSDAWFDVQVFSQPLTSRKGADKKVHETQKPHELISRLVEFGSFPGDRILDPFAGSGSVGAACPEDRQCVLVEKGGEYVRRIEKRLGIRA